MHSRLARGLTYILPLALAGITAYLVSILVFDLRLGARAAPAAPPRPDVLATARAEREQDKIADDAEPRFTGKLGDFDIVASEADALPNALCGGSATTRRESFAPSELNKPNMTEQLLCSDGRVVATYSATGRRSYFSGAPKVYANAPQERIRILDVEGRSAVTIEPVGGMGPTFLYAILRAPTEDKPGIMITVIGRQGLASAIDEARKALAEN